MATPRPQSLYNCSQSELYAICSIGWNSFTENQAAFEAFNTLFTAIYGTDAIAEIDAALNIPSFQERNQATEEAFILLGKAHATCILKWKSLRSYIKNSYPADLQKPKIESAGYLHYSKAANKNWDETKLLLTAGQHFLTINAADLTAGGMPATFAVEYSDAATAYNTLYISFTDLEQDEQEGTDLKIKANNAIYKKLTRMFEDAQIIFETDASKRERFIFTQIKDMISKSSTPVSIPADTVIVEGQVTDFNSGLPLANASVNTTPTGSTVTFSAITDIDGNYTLEVSGLTTPSSGSLSIIAESIDYDTSTTPQVYDTGIKYDLNIQLKKSAPLP